MKSYVTQSMEEALETLNKLLIHMKNLDDTKTVYALAEGIVALEKQIPKMVLHSPDEKGFIEHWRCPSCGRLYWDKKYIANNCDMCGQSLAKED